MKYHVNWDYSDEISASILQTLAKDPSPPIEYLADTSWKILNFLFVYFSTGQR